MGHSRVIVATLVASAAVWPVGADEALDRELYRAAAAGLRPAVEALLAQGANVKSTHAGAYTALHQAARRGHFEVAQLLLEKGADPEARDTTGQTPLWTACFGQNSESDRVFELLLAKGADSSATDANGDAILIYAADIGRLAAVKALLARGAAVDVRTANSTWKGYTPLMKAAQRGRRDVVDVLIAHGADVRARNDTGQNALMEAAGHGQPKIVELLLAKGVGVDEPDKFDRTALMFAAMGGDVAMVDLLVARGADPRRKDGRGDTAYTLAHSDKKEEIARALAKGEKK